MLMKGSRLGRDNDAMILRLRSVLPLVFKINNSNNF